MKERKFKNILITGVSGSVGSYLAEFLIKKKQKFIINGFFRKKNNLKYLKNDVKKIKLFKINLNNFKQTKNYLSKVNPDLIFHLASNADVKKSFELPREIILNNNNCTLNLLESVRTLKINPIIIISSTSEVYGNSKKKIINENEIINPNNPYAVSKTFQDMLANVYFRCFNLKIITIRMFTYLNARRNNLFASNWVNQLIQIEKNNQKYLKHGNLKSYRSIMSINDAVHGYWLAATKGRIGEIYNIGGGKNIQLKQFLKIIIKNSKKKINTKIDKNLLRKTDIKQQIPSSKKFIKHTGWKASTKFGEILKKFYYEIKINSLNN